MRSWVIGSSPECDIVVDSPLASARHCQLTEGPEGFLLDDLQSTNGTYVNGVKISGPILLKRSDSITLGRTVPFPWPPELATSIRIGRLPDNDIVLDDPRVSGHHARLIVVSEFLTLIEDIGSSNGTFLNSADRRLTGPTPVVESDTVYFGTLAVPAARLLRVPIKPEARALYQAPAAAVSQPDRATSPALSLFEFISRHRRLLGWLVQALVLPVMIVLLLGRQPAATTFALAQAAIWVGGSLAIVEIPTRRFPVRPEDAGTPRFPVSFAKRLAILAIICSVGSTVLLAVVDSGSGLKAPLPAMWGVLVLTSLVGLFLGLVMSAPIRNGATTAAVSLIGFVAMTALGGYLQPLPSMNSLVRLVASAMPSRWAFEGLLLLEAAEHPPAATDDVPATPRDHDLAEPFFPATSDRMGPTADALALGSMVIGLAALVMFISGLSRPDPSALSNA